MYFKQKTFFLDFSSARLSAVMASALYNLGSKLSPNTVQIVKDAIYKRSFQPALESIRNYKGITADLNRRWLSFTGNWNPATWAHLTSAAFMIMDSVDDRALIGATAFKNVPQYLDVFNPDGFNSERYDFIYPI